MCTGDEVLRVARDCDGVSSDCIGSLLHTADDVLGPVLAGGGGGGGTMSADGSMSTKSVLSSPVTASEIGGGAGTDTLTSCSVIDGGGGMTHAKYGASDALTTSSNVELDVVESTQTPSGSCACASGRRSLTALPGGAFTPAARRS